MMLSLKAKLPVETSPVSGPLVAVNSEVVCHFRIGLIDERKRDRAESNKIWSYWGHVSEIEIGE